MRGYCRKLQVQGRSHPQPSRLHASVLSALAACAKITPWISVSAAPLSALYITAHNARARPAAFTDVPTTHLQRLTYVIHSLAIVSTPVTHPTRKDQLPQLTRNSVSSCPLPPLL